MEPSGWRRSRRVNHRCRAHVVRDPDQRLQPVLTALRSRVRDRVREAHGSQRSSRARCVRRARPPRERRLRGADIADRSRTRRAELARDGLVVEVADLEDGGAPPPGDHDLVVIVSPVRLGRVSRTARVYAERHGAALSAVPAFWIRVSRPASDGLEDPHAFTSWRWRSPTRCRAPIREREELRVASRLSFGVTM